MLRSVSASDTSSPGSHISRAGAAQRRFELGYDTRASRVNGSADLHFFCDKDLWNGNAQASTSEKVALRQMGIGGLVVFTEVHPG